MLIHSLSHALICLALRFFCGITEASGERFACEISYDFIAVRIDINIYLPPSSCRNFLLMVLQGDISQAKRSSCLLTNGLEGYAEILPLDSHS